MTSGVQLLTDLKSELLSGVTTAQVLARAQALGLGAEADYRLAGILRGGGSALDCLEQLISVERLQASLERRLQRQFAPTRATAKLVSLMPLLGAVGAQLIGLATLSFLIFNPLGWVVLTAGLALNLWGWLWIRRLIAGVQTKPNFADSQVYDFLADCLSAGMSVRQAIQLVPAQAELGEELAQLLQHQRARGYPLQPVLRLKASDLRAAEADGLELALEELPNRLLAPIGLAMLPAFLCLTALPTAGAALLTI